MKKRNVLSSIFILTLAISSNPVIGAVAADSKSTSLTFVVNPYNGALFISVPTDINFGAMTSPNLNETVTVTATTVLVTDTRRESNMLWSTSVVASILTSSSGDTLTANLMSYSPGAIVKTGVLFTTGYNQASLLTAVQVAGSTDIYGINSASWTPSLTLSVPARQVPGTYKGSITHSVS